jgi:GNAT superfamily N-acetyltransferase
VSVSVRPATAERWADLVTVFGRRGADPTWDWCQLLVRSGPPTSVPSGGPPDNRAALRAQVTTARVPVGLIAYVDAHPVGWTRVGPRADFPGVRGNRALARVAPEDGPGTWWVACFAVDRRHRRAGVGAALLGAAVAFAREHAATALQGHPVDVARLQGDAVAGSALYTGTLAMFVSAGFVEVGRTRPTRPVMALSLSGPPRQRPAGGPGRSTAVTRAPVHGDG